MIRNLTFNHSIVEGVIVNSSTVDVVNYRETTVYDNSSHEITFEVYPEFVPHNKSELQPYISSSSATSYTIPTVSLVGNSNFFVRIEKQNAGKITVTSTRPELDCIYKIDEYGYGIFRNTGYGVWVGGSSAGDSYGGAISFTPENDNSLIKLLNILGSVDEDNTVFFKGLFTAKLIRIPYSGINSYLTILFYPYSFDADEEFVGNTKMAALDVSMVGKTTNGVIQYGTRTTVTPETNGSYLSMSIVDSGLLSRINFSAGNNSSVQYKYAFFTFYRVEDRDYTNLMYDTAEVHFILEPYSDSRVYYGNVPTEPNYWEPYADNPTLEYRYHYIFQYTNSAIVPNSLTISMDNTLNTQYRQNVICVPYGSYTINPTSYTVLTDSYYWGTQRYSIYKATATTEYTITKN